MQRSWRYRPALVAVAAGLLLTAVAVGGQVAAVGHPAAGPRAADDPRAPQAAPVLNPVTLGSELMAGGAPSSSTGPSTAEPSSASPAGAALDPDAVEAALAPLLTGGALGPGRSPAHVIDVATGEVLYDASDDPTVPASTMKLVTATSVLDALGTDARLRTRVVVIDPEAKTPRVVIIGAGDPSLRSTGGEGRQGRDEPDAGVPRGARRIDRPRPGPAGDHPGEGRVRRLPVHRAGHASQLGRSFPAAGIVAPVSALVVDQGRRTTGGSAGSLIRPPGRPGVRRAAGRSGRDRPW